MFSFLNNIFKRKNNNLKTKQNAYFKRLELLGLEERITPSNSPITVDTLSDVVDPNDGFISLREAIDTANSTAGDDTIEFSVTGTITLDPTNNTPASLPTILDASVSVGTGPSAGPRGTLTIYNFSATFLTIGGSDTSNPNNATRDFNIFNIETGGVLTIDGVTVSGAQTTGNGGAFNNAGTLTVSNSVISGNISTDNGGAIYNKGTLNVNYSTISGNTAVLGGAIYNTTSGSTLSLSNSTISGNHALASNSGTITTSGSIFAASGGGLYLDNGTVNISNSKISGNDATYTNTGSIDLNNIGAFYAANGAGICVSFATVNIFNSTISGNNSSFTAGTISNVNDYFANYGGGIFNSNGTLNVANTTISGNSSGSGGGIYNIGTINNITNTTIADNSASTNGGGIFNASTAAINIANTTFANNSATTNGAGIYNSSTINIANTIITNSTGTVNVYDGSGTVNLITGSTAANNLVTQSGLSWAINKTYAEIDLGTLQNNGGPPSSADGVATFTMALGSNSAALGTGSTTISNASPVSGTDQRGFSRINSDIGAYAVSNVIKVTTDSDTVDPADNLTSLREAIDIANNSPGNDIINFTGLTGSSTYTITLNSALPTILDASVNLSGSATGTTRGNLTITGLGSSILTISGNNGNNSRDFRIFNIERDGNLSISGVTVSGAQATGYNGGGFYNAGFLNISNSTISGNLSLIHI